MSHLTCDISTNFHVLFQKGIIPATQTNCECESNCYLFFCCSHEFLQNWFPPQASAADVAMCFAASTDTQTFTTAPLTTKPTLLRKLGKKIPSSLERRSRRSEEPSHHGCQGMCVTRISDTLFLFFSPPHPHPFPPPQFEVAHNLSHQLPLKSCMLPGNTSLKLIFSFF